MIKNDIIKLKLTLKIWDRIIRLSPKAVEDTMLIYENSKIQNDNDEESETEEK